MPREAKGRATLRWIMTTKILTTISLKGKDIFFSVCYVCQRIAEPFTPITANREEHGIAVDHFDSPFTRDGIVLTTSVLSPIESWQRNNRFPHPRQSLGWALFPSLRLSLFPLSLFLSFAERRNGLCPICSHERHFARYLDPRYVWVFPNRKYGSTGQFFDTFHGRWQRPATPALIASTEGVRLINERE